MEDYITNVENLLAELLEEIKDSVNWVHYLQAHGVANHLVALDSENEDRRHLVYDIECSWYRGKHPLTYEEHQALTNNHIKRLNDYREETKLRFGELKKQQDLLDVEDLYSEANLDHAHKFATNVFQASKLCSDGFVAFSQCIMKASVDVLSVMGLNPLCPFAVVALGSVARGEATPYSDLEYAFFVKDNSDCEYFRRLAVDTYFRIGNLQESPLKTFDVALKNECSSNLKLPPIGFRIDGLSKKAGHIPTGRGTEQPSLTLTVEEAMNLYKKELMGPQGETPDLSNLLSTSVLVYAFNGGECLHHSFMFERLTFENSEAQSNLFAKQKRLSILSKDVKRYDFLPEFQYMAPSNTEIDVKTKIFRYPTLLATDLNILLGLNLNHPWDIYNKLCELGVVLDEDLKYLKIILGLAIYIRTSAYLAQGTRSSRLSLYTRFAASTASSDRYFVPKNTFVTLGCLLIPVKGSIVTSLERGHRMIRELSRHDTVTYLKTIVTPFRIDKENFMLHTEVLYFLEDIESALKYISKASGVDIADSSFESFIEVMRRKYGTTKSDPLEGKYLSMVFFLLFSTNHYAKALEYLSWLVGYPIGLARIIWWKLYLANCLNKLQRHKAAKNNLFQVISIIKERFGVERNMDLSTFVLSELHTRGSFLRIVMNYFHCTRQVYHNLGHTFEHLDDLPASRKYQEIALDLHRALLENDPDIDKTSDKDLDTSVLLLNLGQVHKRLGNYALSLEYLSHALCIQKAVYGQSTNHTDIALLCNNIGAVHESLGNYTNALKYYTQAQNMFNSMNRTEDYPEATTVCQNIGKLYRNLGNYPNSLTYLEESLRMWVSIYGEGSEQSNIADNLNDLGRVYDSMGLYSKSLEYYLQALQMYQAIHGSIANHSNIADIFGNIAHILGNCEQYAASIEYNWKALNMRKAIYGEDADHPDIAISYNNIGNMHDCLGEYRESLEYHGRALYMRERIYGKDENHPDIAFSLLNLGMIHAELAEYNAALDYYNKCLQMRMRIYDTNRNHPDVAACYEAISAVHCSVGNYVAAFSNAVKAFCILQAADSEHLNYPLIVRVLVTIVDIYRKTKNYEHAHKLCSHLVSKQRIQYLVLNRMAQIYMELSDYTRAKQFLHIALGITGHLPKVIQANIYLQMGICHLITASWCKSWHWLYASLSQYQCLDQTSEIKLSTARVQLAISHLLLHLGHLQPSLEHASKALDISLGLLSNDTTVVNVDYLKVHEEANSIVGSLNLIKLLSHNLE